MENIFIYSYKIIYSCFLLKKESGIGMKQYETASMMLFFKLRERVKYDALW